MRIARVIHGMPKVLVFTRLRWHSAFKLLFRSSAISHVKMLAKNVSNYHIFSSVFLCSKFCMFQGLILTKYSATIVPDSTCAHIFKERDMCRNKLTQAAVKLTPWRAINKWVLFSVSRFFMLAWSVFTFYSSNQKQGLRLAETWWNIRTTIDLWQIITVEYFLSI